MRKIAPALITALFALQFAAPEEALAFTPVDPTLGCTPESEFLVEFEGGPSPAFCAKWNPEYVFAGHRCCPRPKPLPPKKKRRRNANRCSPTRGGMGYCGEMTAEQKEYSERVASGKLDVLESIDTTLGREQSYCTVNNGFVAFGRPLVPTSVNRIKLRTPQRCTNVGTDSLTGMLEWMGRQVAARFKEPEYAGVNLVVGDMSAPRGGCLVGRGGRRGHSSHMAGLDADVTFLVAKARAQSPIQFHKQFDPKLNWWVLKTAFQNPYACIKVVFLDRRLIAKLARVASGDPDWEKLRRFIRHVKGHGNHFHFRVGTGPGLPGCLADPKPELEDETMEYNGEENETE